MAVALVSLLLAPFSSACTYSHGSPKATFDLGPLAKSVGSYMTTDTYARLTRPFDYYFNVCEGVKTSPYKKCEEYDQLGSVTAYQIENGTIANGNKKRCYALGVKEKQTFEIIDSVETKNNAFLGVRVKYEGGTRCRKEGDTGRTFSINVRCVKEATTLKQLSSVSEDLDEGCGYEVDMYSIYGCPTECHTSSHDKLCSGHGVCGIDTESNRARCFCNTGWTGDGCADEQDVTPGTSSASVNTTLIVFVVLLLVALLGLSYVLYGKIKALNADDNPYGALDDQNPQTAI